MSRHWLLIGFCSAFEHETIDGADKVRQRGLRGVGRRFGLWGDLLGSEGADGSRRDSDRLVRLNARFAVADFASASDRALHGRGSTRARSFAPRGLQDGHRCRMACRPRSRAPLSTNPIENVNGRICANCKRVKQWDGGTMILPRGLARSRSRLPPQGHKNMARLSPDRDELHEDRSPPSSEGQMSLLATRVWYLPIAGTCETNSFTLRSSRHHSTRLLPYFVARRRPRTKRREMAAPRTRQATATGV